MAEEKFTRCPRCRTVFRVTQQQLEMRGGQVRCGHCQTVFDGIGELVSLALRADSDDDGDFFDEAALGPPTVTLRSAQALEPPPGSAGPPVRESDEAPVRAPAAADDERSASPQPKERRHWAPAAYALAAALLVLLLLGQVGFHFRDTLVARWPALSPVALQVCRALGCTVGAPQAIADLSIQGSDLQADPAHQGLLILTATLRNRGPLALAYPYLELALTDAQDQVVVRRALAPSEYAGGTVDLAGGIPGFGEVAIKLFIDASATSQAGYRLYVFYG